MPDRRSAEDSRAVAQPAWPENEGLIDASPIQVRVVVLTRPSDTLLSKRYG